MFRGDIVKDEDGVYAVFSEQGAAASNFEAARFVDALARMPNCGGFNVDAIKAFNQIKLHDSCPPTWCSMPRHRWPKEWEEGMGYEDPVVLKEYNFYGHPRAGNH